MGVEDLAVDETVEPKPAPLDDLEPGLICLELPALARHPDPSSWPYAPSDGRSESSPPASPTTVEAMPYFAWANRQPGAMRVWIPRER